MNSILLLLVVGTVALVSIWKLLEPRVRKPSENDYLTVLSFIEWKAGRTVHLELETLLDGTVPVCQFCRDLHRMEDEGWVGHREGVDQNGVYKMFRKAPNESKVWHDAPVDPREEPVLV